MKTLLTLFILLLSFTCYSQKVIGVVDKTDDVIRLHQSNGSKISYSIPDGEYKHQKEYVFYLDIVKCEDCNVKKATVISFAITTNQAQKDQRDASLIFKSHKP